MKTITVENHLGEVCVIELARPEISGLAVLFVNGLTSGTAAVNMDPVGMRDGSRFNSVRALSRDINLALRFIPTQELSVTEVRHKSYKYFPLKKRVKLTFDNGIRKAYAYGYVKSNDAQIFSKETGTLITVLCEDAYLYDVLPGQAFFHTIINGFTFPFSNESLTQKLLYMGNINLQREINIPYTGEVPTGFLLHIHVNGPATNLLFTDVKSLGVLGIDSPKLLSRLGKDLTAGDDFFISTVVGKKYAKLIRDGMTYNILDLLLPNPAWFQLESGNNLLAYSLGSGFGNLTFGVNFDIVYEGM